MLGELADQAAAAGAEHLPGPGDADGEEDGDQAGPEGLSLVRPLRSELMAESPRRG